MRLIHLALALLALLPASVAFAEMVAKPVGWTLDGTTFKNVLVYDDASNARRPGLVMVPNWYGIRDIAIEKAKAIAGKDYVILLTDMYGKAVRPLGEAEARAATAPLYSDRSLMRRRIGKAFAELKAAGSVAPIDPTRLAAIGFCFGGSAVLDLARSGSEVRAVIAFHGGLKTDAPDLAKAIRSRVLAINGANDIGTLPDVPSFKDEMRASSADWQFVEMGGAVHCFTETEATSTAGNCRYDAKVADRAYALMRGWLQESFTAN
jgi:dienelactone hydrolase